jgi:citronellol/citronellal dehydrogenase
MTPPLRAKTLFITGASRGIGKAIALRAAADGANIAVVAKTDTPNPKLEGTVHTACEEIRAAGGRALACVVDVRSEAQIQDAVSRTVAEFGGIDILVNNASAIQLSGTSEVDIKRFDLMHQVNTRGTFLCSKLCLDALSRSQNAHILTLSPPLNLRAEWFGPHLAYSLSKYGMSLCTLGLAEELRPRGIAVNSLWPKTLIATAAVVNLLGGESMAARGRTPQVVADAAYEILRRPSRVCSGNFFIDEEVLRESGVSDFSGYAVTPGADLVADLFV